MEAQVLGMVRKRKRGDDCQPAEELRMEINHASRLLRGCWSCGLLKRLPVVGGSGGIAYKRQLGRTGRDRPSPSRAA